MKENELLNEAYTDNVRFNLLMHHVTKMLNDGIIYENEFAEINTKYAEKYRPYFGGLLFESDLINRKKRAIYIENESRDTKELSA